MSTVTAGPTTLTGWPRSRIWMAVLAVSLALNLLFVAGAVWSRVHHPPGDVPWQEQYQQIAGQLDLDAQQRAGFEKYVAAMHVRTDKMRQEIAPLIAGAWDEMAQPQANQTRAMQQFDEVSQKWREFQRESMVQTLDFLSVLSPAQRSKFVAIVKERRAARFHPH